ncbi:MAG: hypothetical protein INR70_40045 [Parafilimonas terrae]|nr:hypothetical protein [Parafilimonas terrae]
MTHIIIGWGSVRLAVVATPPIPAAAGGALTAGAMFLALVARRRPGTVASLRA